MTITDNIRTWPTPKKIIIGVGVPLALVGGGLLAYDIATMTSSEDTARDSCERQVTAQAKYPGSHESRATSSMLVMVARS